MLVFGSGGSLAMRAAVYGTVAGILFGLSSALTKPTLTYLHESVGTMLSHWECYALAVAGVSSRPGWHILLALVGAIVISLARAATSEQEAAAAAPDRPVATAKSRFKDKTPR